MRSSIACARCRRSKVKCINAGVDTTCRACEASGRECTYPPPVVGGLGGSGKREGGSAEDGGRDTKRQRPRKSASGVPVDGVRTAAGVKHAGKSSSNFLDPALLTPKVWQEIFDIFQLHLSTDLPFFHPPTFLGPIRRANVSLPDHATSNHDPQAADATPPVSPLLLLAILALTARFHPALTAYHSPASPHQRTNPLVASEYYAAALRARLGGPDGEAFARPTIERIQAMLMLGLHEWGMCRGVRAWLIVGIAVRAAQAMGLEYEEDLDDEPLALSSALSAEAEHLGVNPSRRGSREKTADRVQWLVEQEVRRRTFWSCFIMDRYLSSGKYRPQMIEVKDLRVQLPSSDKAFLFGERVRTTLLGQIGGAVAAKAESEDQGSRSAAEDTHEEGRWETGADEGIQSRVVRIIEIWGKIAKWSCKGGRRTEEHPPWRPESTFAALRGLLDQFHRDLPRELVFIKANVQAHISWKSSTAYTVMHTVYFLCLIVLHREYVPFIPIRCSKPQGPLDSPTFPPDKYDIPPGFWDESARELFKAARDMMDLVKTCQEWSALVETPMVGFAIYTVAFVGVYAFYFPQMDRHGYMCSPSSDLDEPATPKTSGGQYEARRAIQIIGQMRARLKMAEGWLRTIRRMHRYYDRIIKDYKRNTQALNEGAGSDYHDRPSFRRHLSLREGGLGGGLDEYKLLEKTLKEFGVLEDEDLDMEDGDEGPRREATSPDETEFSEAGSNAVKSEGPEGPGHGADNGAVRPDGWAAVNVVVPSAQRSHHSDRATTADSLSEVSPYAPSRPPVLGNPPSSMPQYRSEPSAQTSTSRQSGPAASPNPPSLASPVSHTTSTPSFASPYTQPEYPKQQSTSYPATHAQQPSPILSSTHQPNQPPSLPHQTTPTSPLVDTSTNIRATLPPADQAGSWNVEAKESWLNSLHTRLGGDDVAAFVDGSPWEEWAAVAGSRNGAVGGWLSTVWGAAVRDVRT